MVEQALRDALSARDGLQAGAAENANALQLEQTRCEHALKILAQLAQRRIRDFAAGSKPDVIEPADVIENASQVPDRMGLADQVRRRHA